MENTIFNTEKKTSIAKNSRNEWMGETTFKYNDVCWIITTVKGTGGKIQSYAKEVHDEGDGNYSFVPYQDKLIDLVNETATATEAKIKEIHLWAVGKFDRLDDKLKEATLIPADEDEDEN